jgi:predicted permease
VFVAAEVAVALVLLVGAALLVRTVQHLMAVPLGFEPAGVVTLQVQSSGIGSTESDAITRRFADIRDAVERVPGVTSTGLASQLPFTGDADVYGIATRSDSHLPNGADRSAFRYAVSPGYLETLGIPLLSGRTIDERDRADGARVAVISSSLARRRFPGQRPLGKSLRIGGGDLWFTVVGVVSDTKQSSLTTASPDAVYVPAVQWTFADRAMWVTARTAGDPVVLVDDIRRTIAAVAPDQPIVRVATMDQRVRASTARQRFVLAAFYAFAVIAVLLATIGVYGVLAAGVTERTRELALRSAVGASRTSLVTLVLRQAGIVTAAGMVIGAGVSIAATRTLESLLFGVSPLDAMTYAGVALLMVAATTIGALLPAWRAGRIEPALALRAQ